jgi:hypothetical protein
VAFEQWSQQRLVMKANMGHARLCGSFAKERNYFTKLELWRKVLRELKLEN